MKLSKISLAALSALGVLASGSALAIPATSYTNTGEFTGDTLNIRISGASAQDAGVLGSALSLCLAGTMTRYQISNNFVYFCNPDIGTAAGQLTVPVRTPAVTKLAIYKYSVGGAGFGVYPLQSNNPVSGAALGADGNQLPFLDLNLIKTNCTNASASASFGTGLSTFASVSCSAASSLLTSLATTYIGLSDVEPAFFSNNTSNITSSQATALIFGVPVSLNIRNALQAQQGLTVGSETEANMPSLSSGQIVSAYTQVGQTWAGIGVTSGLVGDDTIYVARRVDSSGTQKTFEALFAHSPNGETANKSCSIGTEPFAAPDSGDSAGGLATSDTEALCAGATPSIVVALSGGGNVRNCLNNHNNAGRGAIGILTTEDKFASNWRFVKVDGVTPNQAQTAAGKYRLYTETAFNTRTSGAFATAAASGYSAVVARLKSDLGNPAIIKLINGAPQTFGDAGLMALLSRQAGSPAPDFTGASSILPYTKLVGGATLDNCQAPKVKF